MSTKKLGVVFLPGITALATGARIGTSLFAPPCVGVAPTKRSRPLPPTLLSVAGVSTAPGTLSLTIRLPTANTDGSPLVEAELIKMRIHYASSPGVSESSPYVEQAPSSYTTFAPGLSGTVYVRVAVQDSHGSWSDLSNELSATVPETPRTEFWAHRLSEDSIFSNNTPNAGWVSWSNVTLYFRGIKYAIANGSTNNRYIYWKLTSPNVFLTSNSVPEIGINDVLIGTNVDGYWHLAIYHPQVSAEFLRVGVLQSRNWGPSAGASFNLDDGTFKLGGSSSPKLSWDGSTLSVEGTIIATGGQLGGTNVISISSSGLDVGPLGAIRGGQSGWNVGSGFWLGYADGTYKFSVGSSVGQRLTWDGSTLQVTGTISGSTIVGGTIRTMDSGWRVELSSSGVYPLRYWNGTTTRFYVDISGNVYVSGSIITSGSASDINADYILRGSLIGRPVYGAGTYPYSALVSNYLSAYQSSSYRTMIYPTEFSQLGAQGEVNINQYRIDFNYASHENVIVAGGGGFRLRCAAQGYYLTLETLNADIVADLDSGYSLRPTGLNSNLGTPSYYWNEVNAKAFTDRGCLGDFSDGATVITSEGRKERKSPLAALRNVKAKKEKTKYGKTRLDYSSFPLECYRPAPVAETDITLPDGRAYRKGEKMGEDGIDLTALISVILYALLELDDKVEALSRRVG